MNHTDLVIDTNVLMHCDNETETRCEISKALVSALLAGTTLVCIDDGFHVIEGQNRSLIAAEYLNNLVPGSVGHTAFFSIVKAERLSFVEKTVSPQDSKKIRLLVRDKTDRKFLKVAMNSKEQILVSHDFAAFSLALRPKIRANLKVTVCDASIGGSINTTCQAPVNPQP